MGGSTWVARISAGKREWYGITSSADGTRLAAMAHGEYIYTSIDSGITWTPKTFTGMKSWRGAASSADGLKVAACAPGGGIVTNLIT